MFPVSKQETVEVLMKPHDTLIALKYYSINRLEKENILNKELSSTGLPPNYGIRALADVIGISSGEISKATKRLEKARLVAVRDKVSVISRNLMEWLSYGMRYYSPLETQGYGRGIATGWNCHLIKSDMFAPQPGWAWASSQGDIEAELIIPFHDSVPLAARYDSWLYQALSLIEVIRGGKPRELFIARDLLAQHLKD